ncbi:MAG: hypothetical protein KIS78_36780 [Labilithrix sp.]|nr:hypothetical protein [Labilithrix sp.]MCW5838004.1 hypothetical protein [Labilithrix sp.]
MTTFVTILDIACGRPIPAEDSGRARRLQLVVFALLASLAFAGAWGLAAGSQAAGLAIANLYKVPMVILLSCVFAAPAGLLAWRLSGAPVRGTDLALGFSGGVFGGTLVLAVLAPLVALYYQSSAWAGPLLGIGSAALALVVGTVMFVRGTIRRLPPGAPKLAALLPVVVTLGMQLLTLLQLAAIAAPIFPERTPFSGGIDHLAR